MLRYPDDSNVSKFNTFYYGKSMVLMELDETLDWNSTFELPAKASLNKTTSMYTVISLYSYLCDTCTALWGWCSFDRTC